MKYIFFLILSSFCLSQVSDFEDQLVSEMCKTFIENKEFEDSVRVENMYLEHLYPYFATLEEKKIDSVGTSIYYRLQRNCPEFLDFLNKKNSLNSMETQFLNERLESDITKKDLFDFKKNSNFYYVDEFGKTKVHVQKGIWKEVFDDNSISANQINWLKNNKFELTFIESNNHIKKSLSKKGEKYVYEIISKTDNYFLLQYEIPQLNQFVVFKLHVND